MIGHTYRAPHAAHRRQAGHEQILERIHGNLYSIVGEAVDEIKLEEQKWSKPEMVKRIVGYIFKAAKAPEFLQKQWQEVSKTLVHNAMGSYMAACGEKPWFYQLGLGNAFTSAVWELVQARGASRVHYQDVQDFTVREFESYLDKSLLTKAVWDATELTFPKNELIRGKVFKAVHNTYHPVLEELLADRRPADDARKVETFTRRWMESSMTRAWSAIEDAENVLQAQTVVRLFQNLIAPFGEGHEYTCIPSMLVEQIGRPPRNWKFLKTAVNKMFEDWRKVQDASQPAKRRRKGGGVPEPAEPVEPRSPPAQEEEEVDVPEEEEEMNPPEEEELGEHVNGVNGSAKDEVLEDEEEEAELKDFAQVEDNGHPECTSANDCLGTPADGLVRHMIEGEDGDVYCEAWTDCDRNTQITICMILIPGLLALLPVPQP
eukprot:g7217.t1